MGDVYQNTLLSLEIKADSLLFYTNVGIGKIISAFIKNFESL